ncbi:DotA/TraY family protein [Vibrio parahaemolyticus]|uniref:DotA/TraY family protein n=1 Tax=Vibrio parahaemolyticus TaxID=670 RepID=UPI00226A5D69|nr:DotA/TraY family protein [Vibrio parahaemolyticus]MCX8796228.1 DotA/TraY family protein [Vibrio parahaemolyticus]
MNINKIPIKNVVLMFFIFFLALGSASAYASDVSYGENSVNSAFNNILNMPVSLDPSDANVDYFHVWLRIIFGSFIFEPWTNDSGDISILASAIGFTNLLAITFGTVVMVYVLGGGALNSTHSGEVLNRNWSPVWMPIRSVLGIGLVMPVPGIGGGVMSMSQVGIIWLVIFGSNSATFLWNNTAEKLTTDGIYGYSPVSPGNKPLLNIAQSLTCVDHNVKAERVIPGYKRAGSDANKAQIATVDYYTGRTKQIKTVDGKTKKVYEIKQEQVFADVIKTDAETYSYRIANIGGLNQILKSDIQVNKVNFQYGCGSISVIDKSDAIINENQSLTSADLEEIKNFETAFGMFQKDTLPKAIDAAFSIAIDIGDLDKGNPERAYQQVKSPNIEGANEQILRQIEANAERFAIAGSQFQEAVTHNIPSYLFRELTGNEKKQVDRITKGGWAAAGLWFIEVGSTQQKVGSLDIDNKISPPSVANLCQNVTSNIKASTVCKQSSANYDAAIGLLTHLYKASNGYVEGIDPKAAKSNSVNVDSFLGKCPNYDDCEIDEDVASNYATSTAQWILNNFASGPILFDEQEPGETVEGNMFNPAGFSNPFLTLSSIGHTMNSYAMAGYGIGVLAKATSAAMPGIGEGWAASLDGTGVIKAGLRFGASIVGSVANLVFVIVLSYLACGFVLAYMIPFLPVIAWTNMMIGYLVTVIEASTAAPLAVVQMLLPEGQGILGQRLERAMQLLIVVILKPSLMIIGLIGAITIASLGFTIFNTFFWSAAKMYLYGSPLDLFALIALYTATALTITQTIVSIMYTLPNHILEWFAGGAGNRGFGEDKVGESLKGSVSDIKHKADGIMRTLKMNARRQSNKDNDAPDNGDDKKG